MSCRKTVLEPEFKLRSLGALLTCCLYHIRLFFCSLLVLKAVDVRKAAELQVTLLEKLQGQGHSLAIPWSKAWLCGDAGAEMQGGRHDPMTLVLGLAEGRDSGLENWQSSLIWRVISGIGCYKD